VICFRLKGSYRCHLVFGSRWSDISAFRGVVGGRLRKSIAGKATGLLEQALFDAALLRPDGLIFSVQVQKWSMTKSMTVRRN